MSAAQHEAAAQQEEAASESHASQYEPAARTIESRCGGKVCWSSRANPTEEHLQDAATHRELAAKHRAASSALKQAEAQACAGIDADDRDMSPFAHREDIQRVTILNEAQPQPGGRSSVTRRVGATVVFRAVPGMTAEWLQRVVECHIARAAAVGHEMPEMSYCPLALPDVNASVKSVRDGFAVNIRAEDSATIDAVIQRAQALVSGEGGATTPSVQP